VELYVLGPHPEISYDNGYWGFKIRDIKSVYAQNHLTPINGRFVWLSIDNWDVWIPHWVLVLLSAVFAALPWLPWKFSLRTLLIATTLIAVVLGLIGIMWH
jgi:hypothetical protein